MSLLKGCWDYHQCTPVNNITLQHVLFDNSPHTVTEYMLTPMLVMSPENTVALWVSGEVRAHAELRLLTYILH